MALFIGMTACVGVETTPETSETIAKISSRRIGLEVQSEHPSAAKEIYKVCKLVLTDVESGGNETLKKYAHELLQQSINDPLLASDIMDLIGLIKINPDVPLTEGQIRIVKAIAEGFISGIELSGGI